MTTDARETTPNRAATTAEAASDEKTGAENRRATTGGTASHPSNVFETATDRANDELGEIWRAAGNRNSRENAGQKNRSDLRHAAKERIIARIDTADSRGIASAAYHRTQAIDEAKTTRKARTIYFKRAAGDFLRRSASAGEMADVSKSAALAAI